MDPDSAHTVFEGVQFSVVRETWEGDRTRDIVKHRGSVAVVALDRARRLVLVRQVREPARRPLLELPAGTREEGEEPLATAQRELEEECGLTGGRWQELGAYYTSPGFLDERMHLFLAEEVEEGGEQDLDDGEDVALVRIPLGDLRARLGEIEDLKTLAGALLLLDRDEGS